jgi:3alpha(or 20beta)-hydroxysteroid dehydrogenase
MSRLDGRVALVTGAAGGIGSRICERLRADGAIVVASDLAPPASNGMLRHDVADPAGWQAVEAKIAEAHGRIDILAHVAALFDPAPLLDTTTNALDAHYGANQRGFFLGLQAIARLAPETGASVVAIGSVAALSGSEGAFAYVMSKWAARGMARAAARELAGRGIRVNSVLPGLIDTAMARRNPPERNAAISESIPMRRLGAPEEVGDLVAWLASDEARYVTGADFVVDGGLSA